MTFFFLVIYKSGGNLQIVIDIETGVCRKFNTRSQARRYAIQNCLGIYEIHKFGR